MSAIQMSTTIAKSRRLQEMYNNHSRWGMQEDFGAYSPLYISEACSCCDSIMQPYASQFAPDNDNIDPIVPGFYARNAVAVNKVHVQIQLLSKLDIQALCAGIGAAQRGEEGAFHADPILFY